MCCLLICLGGSTRKSVSSSEIPAEHLKFPSAQSQSAILNSVPTPQLMAPILGRRLRMQQSQFLGSRTWATFRMMAFRAFPRFPWTWGGNRVTPTILSQCNHRFCCTKDMKPCDTDTETPKSLGPWIETPSTTTIGPSLALHIRRSASDNQGGRHEFERVSSHLSIDHLSFIWTKKNVASQPRWLLFDRPWVSWASVASPGLFPGPTGWRSDLWVQGALPMQLLLEFLRRGVLSGTSECWCCCDGIKHHLPIILSLVLRKFLDPNP